VRFATEVVGFPDVALPSRPPAYSITSLEGSVAEAKQCATVDQRGLTRPLLLCAMSLQDKKASIILVHFIVQSCYMADNNNTL
jgi:hypothetical protein